MEWRQRRGSTWAIRQFSVSPISQATKFQREIDAFSNAAQIPVVKKSFSTIFAACESRILIPHTTLGTFNLLCLSKDRHRTERNR